MRAICVDDSALMLDMLKALFDQIEELKDVQYFQDPRDALEYSESGDFEIAFLDIQMPEINGITLAQKIKKNKPGCDIIFITSESEYKSHALQEKCSGYLIKPVSIEEIQVQLHNIMRRDKTQEDFRMRVQCFGNFEVFVDGVPIKFQRQKSREVFAYLVDRQGARSTVREICAVVWEDSDSESNAQAYLRKCISDMKATFAEHGMDDVLIAERGAYSVNKDAFWCDYYEYLKGNPDAVKSYRGEYMIQYSWSEYTMVE